MNGLDGFDPNDALTHAFQAFIVFLRLACFGDISNRLRARSFLHNCLHVLDFI